MLNNLLILTFILLYKTILNKGCDQSSCSACFKLKATSFLSCICSNCQYISYGQECDQATCKFCSNFKVEIAFNCKCANCHYGNGGNGIKTIDETGDNTNVITYFAFIFSVFLILIIALCCYIKCRKNANSRGVITRNNNQFNIEYNRNTRNIRFSNNNNNNRNIALDVNNINYNIDSHSNIIIPVKRPLTLEEIFTNEKYLGPKKCKKEYEKYNIECTICLEKFKDDIDMVCLTPCSHLFHNKCLYDYFHANKNAKCPNCNSDIINHYQK